MKLTKSQLLLLAALLAFGVTIATTISMMWRKHSDPPAHFDEWHMQCARCGHQDFVKCSSLPGGYQAAANRKTGGGFDCPRCKAAGVFYLDTPCPGCGTWNLTPRNTDTSPEAPTIPECRCKSCGRKL